MLTTTITMRNRRNFLHDSQAVHRTLMHSCETRPLFGVPDALHLVIRHDKPVDWATEFREATQCVTLPTEVPITGAPIRYAIIANPTGARHHDRYFLPPEKWNQWLERKLGEAINLHTIDATKLTASSGRRHNMKVTHGRVLFTGDGTVKNHDTLKTLMHDGVGRGKAYGCGLLLVEALP